MSANNQFRKEPHRFDAISLIKFGFILAFFSAILVGIFYGRTTKVTDQKAVAVKPVLATDTVQEPQEEAFKDSTRGALYTDIRAGEVVSCSMNVIKPPSPEAISTTAIHPPLPAADVAGEKETVMASIGLTITSTKRTMIYIPPDAFVDGDGKVVKGDVEVKYREFHNYADIMLSGIPMKYDATHQLESAGMIEITASLDNVPVYVNKERKIQVMLASMNKSRDFNLYYFDRQQNKWIDKGSDIVNGSTPVYDGSGNYYIGDSTIARFSFKAENYAVRPVSNGFVDSRRKSFFSRKKVPAKFTFHFAASENTAPETKLISRFRWSYAGYDAMDVCKRMLCVDGGHNSKEGNRRDTLPKGWRNVVITPIDDGTSYMLTMYGSGDTLSAMIRPELSTERSIMRFNERFDDFLSNQQKRLDGEKRAFEKFQKDTVDYYASNGHYIKTQQTIQTYATRQFAIDGFGIWNCDRQINLPTAASINASFVNETGATVLPLIVYMVDRSLNTVYSYSGNGLASLKFNPASEIVLCAVLPGGRLGVIKPKEFRERYASASSRCTFMLHESKIISSGEEARSLLAFK